MKKMLSKKSLMPKTPKSTKLRSVVLMEKPQRLRLKETPLERELLKMIGENPLFREAIANKPIIRKILNQRDTE